MTRGKVELLPVTTEPKDKIAGLAVTASLVTPEPSTVRESVGFEALLVKLMVPLVHPVILGVKLTLRSRLSPAERSTGRSSEEVTNFELVTLIPESVALVSPVLVKVTSKVSVLPVSTAPKRRVEGEHVS